MTHLTREATCPTCTRPLEVADDDAQVAAGFLPLAAPDGPWLAFCERCPADADGLMPAYRVEEVDTGTDRREWVQVGMGRWVDTPVYAEDAEPCGWLDEDGRWLRWRFGDHVEAHTGGDRRWRPAVVREHRPYSHSKGRYVTDGYEIRWDFAAEGVKQEQWHSEGGWCPTAQIRSRPVVEVCEEVRHGR